MYNDMTEEERQARADESLQRTLALFELDPEIMAVFTRLSDS